MRREITIFVEVPYARCFQRTLLDCVSNVT